MPRKKKEVIENAGFGEPNAFTVTAESSDPVREPLEVKPEPEKGKERLGFAVTTDGKVDWDSMRDVTKARLKEVLGNSTIPGMETKKEPPFSRETLMMFWSGIGALETLAAVTWAKVPQDIAAAIFPYNQQQAEALADGLNKVLAKYDWVSSVKYREEFDLAGMFLTITVMKIMACRELMVERKKSEKKGQATNSQQAATGAA